MAKSETQHVEELYREYLLRDGAADQPTADGSKRLHGADEHAHHLWVRKDGSVVYGVGSDYYGSRKSPPHVGGVNGVVFRSAEQEGP